MGSKLPSLRLVKLLWLFCIHCVPKAPVQELKSVCNYLVGCELSWVSLGWSLEVACIPFSQVSPRCSCLTSYLTFPVKCMDPKSLGRWASFILVASCWVGAARSLGCLSLACSQEEGPVRAADVCLRRMLSGSHKRGQGLASMLYQKLRLYLVDLRRNKPRE